MSPLALFDGPQGLILKWILIAALVAGFGGWSYMQGVHREADRRDAQDAQIAAQEHATAQKLAAYGVEQAKSFQSANQTAVDFYNDLQRSIANAKRSGTPLVAGYCPDAPVGPPAPDRPTAGPDVRLTWQFVSLWDAAIRSRPGQPVPGNPAGTPGGPAGSSASPYSPDDALANHETNEQRADTCRRQLRALNTTIDGLQKAWDQAHPRKK